MITVDELLRVRSGDLWTISPQAKVFDALKLLAEKDIGALLVVENEKLVGVFSERDYARKIVLKGKTSVETPVWEIMTQNVIAVTPEHSLDDCMTLMTNERIRHLPVVAQGKLIGIVSIGDIVKAIIQESGKTIQDLQHYIVGGGYGQ